MMKESLLTRRKVIWVRAIFRLSRKIQNGESSIQSIILICKITPNRCHMWKWLCIMICLHSNGKAAVWTFSTWEITMFFNTFCFDSKAFVQHVSLLMLIYDKWSVILVTPKSTSSHTISYLGALLFLVSRFLFQSLAARSWCPEAPWLT